MDLTFSETGALYSILGVVTDYLDQQSFVWPQYAVQIAGLRAGIVGTCQLLNRNAFGTISGSLVCDGSQVVSNMTVDFNNVAQ